MQHSNKIGAQILLQQLLELGVKDIIISPGSRNAPLIIEAVNIDAFNLISITDERSAAFVGLGLAQQKQIPVALFCTSGSAVLNYAPALAEAYYMKIPLIAISADRPEELIEMADGQTIKQFGALQNVVKSQINLPEINAEEKQLRLFYRNLVFTLQQSIMPPEGPIHINIAFTEPLYLCSEQSIHLPFPQFNYTQTKSNNQTSHLLSNSSFQNQKIMLLVGQRNSDEIENNLISEFCKKNNVALFYETTSNLPNGSGVGHIDIFLESLNQSEKTDFLPDVLITYKTNIVSKKLKTWLKSKPGKQHIHIGKEYVLLDTYFSLNYQVETDIKTFIQNYFFTGSASYCEKIQKKSIQLNEFAENFEAQYSDFEVFKIISHQLKVGSIVYFGNSASIRYAQLFNGFYNYQNFCNRGTSGIEGCLSTAVGAAYAQPGKTVYCILGDTSFFYDSNALYNNMLPNNLKIILINNGGGGIFKIIDGPTNVKNFEKYIEAKHDFSAKQLCNTFKVNYFEASSIQGLTSEIKKLNDTCNVALLEVNTMNVANEEVIKSFFKKVKELHS